MTLPLCEIAKLLGVPRRTVYYHVRRQQVKPVAVEAGAYRGRARGLYDVEAVRWAYVARRNCGPRRPGVDYGINRYGGDQ